MQYLATWLEGDDDVMAQLFNEEPPEEITDNLDYYAFEVDGNLEDVLKEYIKQYYSLREFSDISSFVRDLEDGNKLNITANKDS